MNRSDLIRFYSNKSVQEKIISVASHREVVTRYNDKVGSRPNVLLYDGDIMEAVNQGATSFHASIERWTNPFLLENSKSKKEIESIRIGWDLLLDIDCPYLKYSKICAKLILDALEFHGIKNYSIKFSGNSGFHIGVPYESFPTEINKMPVKDLFPDAARVIAQYLKQMISEQLAEKIFEFEGSDIKKIEKTTGKQAKELVKDGMFYPFSIINIDTVAISHRHLFRMPYTFNEKRWLISVPLRKKDIDNFDIKDAEYQNVCAELGFLDKSEPNEAKQLFIQAFDWYNREIVHKESLDVKEEYEIPKEAVDKKYFPPCILKILDGLEDGRKRSLFILLNFLRSVGWDNDSIQKEIIQWNKRNKEPLRESYISSQINWFKRKKSSYLPPNCNSKNYYVDIGVCNPDKFCKTNPVVYVFKKMRLDKKRKA